jgi:hypothetical protein
MEALGFYTHGAPNGAFRGYLRGKMFGFHGTIPFLANSSAIAFRA